MHRPTSNVVNSSLWWRRRLGAVTDGLGYFLASAAVSILLRPANQQVQGRIKTRHIVRKSELDLRSHCSPVDEQTIRQTTGD